MHSHMHTLKSIRNYEMVSKSEKRSFEAVIATGQPNAESNTAGNLSDDGECASAVAITADVRPVSGLGPNNCISDNAKVEDSGRSLFGGSKLSVNKSQSLDLDQVDSSKILSNETEDSNKIDLTEDNSSELSLPTNIKLRITLDKNSNNSGSESSVNDDFFPITRSPANSDTINNKFNRNVETNSNIISKNNTTTPNNNNATANNVNTNSTVNKSPLRSSYNHNNNRNSSKESISPIKAASLATITSSTSPPLSGGGNNRDSGGNGDGTKTTATAQNNEFSSFRTSLMGGGTNGSGGGGGSLNNVSSNCNSNINNTNNNNNNNNKNTNNNNNNNINNNNNNNNNNGNLPPKFHIGQATNFSMNKNEEFYFEKPPECPVFRPNDEEFKNPLTYISKLRSTAEKYGICKIIPPKTWTPPFTVDVEKLRFTPRVQRLNELEAKTRVKLNFLDQIAKFWELQGSSLKIPMVERKALDLYTLHRLVQDEGGIEQTTKERKWSKVAQRMGYPIGKSVGTILKGHYERILHPFDVFTTGKTVDLKLEPESDDQDYKPHGIVSRQQITPPSENTARRSKRFANSAAARESGCGFGIYTPAGTLLHIKDEIKKEKDVGSEYKLHEYRRHQMFGNVKTMGCKGSRSRSVTQRKTKLKDIDPLAKYICHICNRGDAEEAMLLCDGCDDSYHTFCLTPPLNDIPKGDWRCPKCVVEEVSKPVEAFGFEQAQREYTLQQFGEMADQFKADYFNMSVHLVPSDLVEREFWRIVSSIDEDVTVEYGADLHTMDHGSGFPTKNSFYALANDQEYAESSWNLNNLPLLEESILGHINADISGMKVPWMYVGMCFATFCWHNEDHWSYSINYLHWGEPKTWYGVPGSKAEAFEQSMRGAAPELFQSQPDLLHQLVTIMNPNILMKAGVPVYRTDQHAGEFVITFPRAYHAGFNQGYNFAEAVNFAPADWLKMGRECINHYSTLRRFCVFSHDELVCKMALDPDKLNLGIATACYLDMAEMVTTEKKLRKSLLDWGVTKAEREAFELIPDDERQCESCKTTCFLSAVTCVCTKAIVCLRHFSELCNCPAEKHVLKYRYTLDELPLMLKKLKVKAESFEHWLSQVRDVLDPGVATSITLDELQELAQEAEDKKFPRSVLLERLNAAVLEAEKCVTVIQHLDINKMRTRTRYSYDSAKYKLTLDELDMFVQEIDNLCCVLDEGCSVRDLQALGKEFVKNAEQELAKSIDKGDSEDIEQLIENGSSLCIELPQIKLLKDRLQQVNWYTRVRDFREAEQKIPLGEIKELLSTGIALVPDAVIEREIVKLQGLLMTANDWEMVAQKCFQSGTQHELPKIELILEKAEQIEVELPSQVSLKDAVKKAREWLHTVDTLQSNENYPYFHTLENVVNRGKNIPFQLEELKPMEDHLKSARFWKDRTSRAFLKKRTTFSLMDVLSPRTEAVMMNSKLKKRSLEDQFTEGTGPAQMVIAFKNAEEKELRDMRELRRANMEKNPAEDKYCICKRKFQGLMYNCQLCKDWFHNTCVPPPKNTVRQRSVNSSSAATAPLVPSLNLREKDREMKYLCPSCMRSRRPRLEGILSILVLLQRLPIRLPEGEALQCLTERAMNWQERVRQAFDIEEVTQAIAALCTIAQKVSDSHGLPPIEKNANNSVSKKAKQTRNNKKRSLTLLTSDDGENDDFETSSDEEEIRPTQPMRMRINIPTSNEASPSSPTKIEHAYSVPPPSATSILSSHFGKVVNGPNNPLKKSDLPLITLSKSIKDKLEELMMEGDLLEVSLDETLFLWRLLNAAKPSVSDLTQIYYKYKIASFNNEILVSSIKKRRSEDNATPITPKRTLKGSTQTTVNSKDNNTGSGGGSAGGSVGGSGSGSGGGVGVDAQVTSSRVRRGRKRKLIATKDTDSFGLPKMDSKRKGKRKLPKREQVSVIAAASTSDDEEECSVVDCARPSGREVDWVQCDGGCNKWFHMFCVGLDKNQIKPDDDFICKRCKKGYPTLKSKTAEIMDMETEESMTSANAATTTATTAAITTSTIISGASESSTDLSHLRITPPAWKIIAPSKSSSSQQQKTHTLTNVTEQEQSNDGDGIQNSNEKQYNASSSTILPGNKKNHAESRDANSKQAKSRNSTATAEAEISKPNKSTGQMMAATNRREQAKLSNRRVKKTTNPTTTNTKTKLSARASMMSNKRKLSSKGKYGDDSDFITCSSKKGNYASKVNENKREYLKRAKQQQKSTNTIGSSRGESLKKDSNVKNDNGNQRVTTKRKRNFSSHNNGDAEEKKSIDHDKDDDDNDDNEDDHHNDDEENYEGENDKNDDSTNDDEDEASDDNNTDHFVDDTDDDANDDDYNNGNNDGNASENSSGKNNYDIVDDEDDDNNNNNNNNVNDNDNDNPDGDNESEDHDFNDLDNDFKNEQTDTVCDDKEIDDN